ncbi:MAG: LysE family transporter [Candidatus Kariarchaeaceae archaeon]
MNFGDFLFLAILGFSLALPLGPVNMEMIKQGVASKRGWILGILTGIGAMTGDFVISMSVLFVGSELLASVLEVKVLAALLFFANAALLGYIGYNALKSSADTSSIMDDDTTKFVQEKFQLSAISKQYMLGFVIVVTSPWSYLWWASFGPVILESDIEINTFTDRFIVTLMFLVGILAWVLIINIALLISHEVASEKMLNNITRISAGVILLFALSILIDGFAILLYDEPLGLINKLFEIF